MFRLVALLLPVLASACSNWLMSNEYMISGRTMDLGSYPFEWTLATTPRGATLEVGAGPYRTAKYGFVGVFPEAPGGAGVRFMGNITAGLNEPGLSCDGQTLISTKMPAASGTSADLLINYFCQWALANYATTDEVREALRNGTAHVWGPPSQDGPHGTHHVLRDALGRSLVVEHVGGETQVYQDLNDGGKTGYGLMTNEPEYPFMVRLVQHTEWKRGLARPAVTMPGTWYPDERFLRLHLVKEGMPQPSSYREAMMQAAYVLNVVTVPMGDQMGTDSGAGEGTGDHTLWGMLYDHKNNALYFRTTDNMNLQRVRLADLDLAEGAKVKFLPLTKRNALPWFNDATHGFAS